MTNDYGGSSLLLGWKPIHPNPTSPVVILIVVRDLTFFTFVHLARIGDLLAASLHGISEAEKRP